MTRGSLQEYAAVQRERYLRAPRAEKQRLLNEVVAVAGLHRKAAIRLLRRPPRPPARHPRSGRPRLYGRPVAAAAQLLSEATGHIGPHRWHPFLPELLDRLSQSGDLVVTPDVDKHLRQVSPATLLSGSPSQIVEDCRAYVAVGVQHFVLDFSVTTVPAMLEVLERFAADVRPRVLDPLDGVPCRLRLHEVPCTARFT